MKFDWKSEMRDYLKEVVPGVCFWLVIFVVGVAGIYAFAAFLDWLGVSERWQVFVLGLFSCIEFTFIAGCVKVFYRYITWKRNEAKRREFDDIVG